MEIKTKKQFKNLDDVYNSKNYFWKYGTYVNYYRIDYDKNKPRLMQKIDDNWEELAKGLKGINRMMKLKNLEVEI